MSDYFLEWLCDLTSPPATEERFSCVASLSTIGVFTMFYFCHSYMSWWCLTVPELAFPGETCCLPSVHPLWGYAPLHSSFSRFLRLDSIGWRLSVESALHYLIWQCCWGSLHLHSWKILICFLFWVLFWIFLFNGNLGIKMNQLCSFFLCLMEQIV